jgi:signal transduction histidine kinase
LKEGTITSWPAGRSVPTNDSIAEDRAGNLWFSADGKLTRFRDGHFTLWTVAQGLPQEPVRELLGDRAGNLWLSTPGHGLTLLRDGRFRRFDTRDGLAENEVTALYEGRSGQLWFGTRRGGISRFEAETQRFTSWMAKDGIPGDQVLSFYEDRTGSLWIGTDGGGLRRFKDGRFTAITVRDGLHDNRTFQLLSDTDDDSGDLWVSSNRGIFRINLRELNDFADGHRPAVTSFAYGVADGMLSRECNGASPGGWKTHDGRLWFPTVKGVVSIDPRQRNIPPSLVAIERVILDRVPLPAGQPVRIEPDQENLEIEYTGINWQRPQQIRFKYQLAGFNQDWVEVGTRRTAYFSNLPPGDYTFRVLADNSEGLWSTEGKSIRITVLPPFYRTWWFLSLAVMSVTGIVFVAFRYRVKQLEERQAVQQTFARQLIESQEAERKRIAAELHDSLSQSLVIIKNRALMALQAPVNLDRATAQLEEIAESSGSAIDEVREIAYALRPFHLDRLGLTKAIAEMAEKMTAAPGIQVTIDLIPLDGLWPPEVEINVYRIVQESLNNIVKHAQATACTIAASRAGRTVELAIADNGRGFSLNEPVANSPATAHQPKSGFGLLGMAERARLLGGQWLIQSASGAGTTVTIRLSVPEAG